MAKVRMRTVEIVVAVSVVVISVASLFVAVHQSIVMERTLAASVWPVMEFEHGNYSEDRAGPEIYLAFRNSGLGPAQVRWLRLRHEGRTIESPQRFFAACCGPAEMSPAERVDHVGRLFLERKLFFVSDVVEGRVFAPQQEVRMASLPRPDDPEARRIWDAIDEARFGIEVELCYCSVFEDCWIGRFPEQTRTEVVRCEPPQG